VLIDHSTTKERTVTLVGIYNENGYTAYLILGHVFYRKAGEDAFRELTDAYDDETRPILYGALLAGDVAFAEPLLENGEQEAANILRAFAYGDGSRLTRSLSDNEKSVLWMVR
jgi:hypothetical protein